MNIRAAHGALYTPIYDYFLMGTFEEYPLVCEKVFKVLSDKTQDYLVDDISGLGRWDSTAEAEAGETEDPVLGYAKTYTHGKFTKTFQASNDVYFGAIITICPPTRTIRLNSLFRAGRKVICSSI